jgi:hypothetical protein
MMQKLISSQDKCQKFGLISKGSRRREMRGNFEEFSYAQQAQMTFAKINWNLL